MLGAVGLEVHGEDASPPIGGGRCGGEGHRHRARRSWIASLSHARERGLGAVYLLTTTAEGYFPRFGFARITREEVPDPVQASVEFREACPASAVVMRKLASAR